MTPTPRPKRHSGVSPAWSNLPRRRCDDCGKNYKPVRPVKEDERGFCTATCRKSYHKHGGAYRKLKVEMKKMIEKGIKDAVADLRKQLDAIVYRQVQDALAQQSETPSPAAQRASR
jgi:hypothetical protein